MRAAVKLNRHAIPFVGDEAEAVAAVHYRIAADADDHHVAAKTRPIDQLAPNVEKLAQRLAALHGLARLGASCGTGRRCGR